MELLEIKGTLEMEPGAPNPVIISSDNDLMIAFYKREDDEVSCEAMQSQQVTVMRFTGYLKYTFESPGDETIHGHPHLAQALV